MTGLCCAAQGKFTATALGIFDGVHAGHRQVLRTAAFYGGEHDLLPAVCSFSTATVTTKGQDYRPIYSDEIKTSLLKDARAVYVCLLDFKQVRDMSPEDFVRDVLFDTLHTRAVVCGRDFRFGKGAQCGTAGLEKICGRMGMKLIVVDDALRDGVKISSADIRRLIAEGNMEKVNSLMGRDYFIRGKVIEGNRLGRTIGFPTANQLIDTDCVCPSFGVYSSCAVIDGKTFSGITNIGIKPTVGYNGAPLAETFFRGFSGDLYGRVIDVSLKRFIRPERKFESTDDLRAQIAIDSGQ